MSGTISPDTSGTMVLTATEGLPRTAKMMAGSKRPKGARAENFELRQEQLEKLQEKNTEILAKDFEIQNLKTELETAKKEIEATKTQAEEELLQQKTKRKDSTSPPGSIYDHLPNKSCTTC
jgi:small-conductance mechanosensitive channel